MAWKCVFQLFYKVFEVWGGLGKTCRDVQLLNVPGIEQHSIGFAKLALGTPKIAETLLCPAMNVLEIEQHRVCKALWGALNS